MTLTVTVVGENDTLWERFAQRVGLHRLYDWEGRRISYRQAELAFGRQKTFAVLAPHLAHALILWRAGRASRCLDCRKDTVPFMVHDSVWQAAGLHEDDGWICLQCLTLRLGRLMTKSDLRVDLPMMNSWLLESGA